MQLVAVRSTYVCQALVLAETLSQAVSYQRVVLLQKDVLQFQFLQGPERAGEIFNSSLCFIICVCPHISIFIAISIFVSI